MSSVLFIPEWSTEIIAAPKVYGFDTEFVCYHRGWSTLRVEDMGFLWEHFVLNEMMAHKQSRNIRYWRDKQHHEVDFILASRKEQPTVIECKWSAGAFSPEYITAFRKRYPNGRNFVVSHDVDRDFTRIYNHLRVKFVSLEWLMREI